MKQLGTINRIQSKARPEAKPRELFLKIKMKMEKYRSMSCREGRIKMESFNSNNGGNGDHHSKAASSSFPSIMQDLRSFSTSSSNTAATNSSYYAQNPNNQSNGDHKSSRRSSSSCSRGGVWGLADPELQRKKRVASYKVYAVEGKMKGSLRKSFRWIKNTCSQVVYAWR